MASSVGIRPLGRAVQVDPITPTLEAPGAKRLKLKYDVPISNFAFKFNLRHLHLGPSLLPALCPLRLPTSTLTKKCSDAEHRRWRLYTWDGATGRHARLCRLLPRAPARARRRLRARRRRAGAARGRPQDRRRPLRREVHGGGPRPPLQGGRGLRRRRDRPEDWRGLCEWLSRALPVCAFPTPCPSSFLPALSLPPPLVELYPFFPLYPLPLSARSPPSPSRPPSHPPSLAVPPLHRPPLTLPPSLAPSLLLCRRTSFPRPVLVSLNYDSFSTNPNDVTYWISPLLPSVGPIIHSNLMYRSNTWI